MSRLSPIFFFMLLAPVTITYAQVNPVIDCHVQNLIEQAQSLVDQGIPKNEVLCLFEQALAKEIAHQETVSNTLEIQEGPLVSKKIILVSAVLCVLGFTLGAGVMYLAFQDDLQNEATQHRNRCTREDEANRQTVEVLNEQIPNGIAAQRNALCNMQILADVQNMYAQNNDLAPRDRLAQIPVNITRANGQRYQHRHNVHPLRMQMEQEIQHQENAAQVLRGQNMLHQLQALNPNQAPNHN